MALFVSSIACGMGVRRSPAGFEGVVGRVGAWIESANNSLGVVSDTVSVASATCGVLSNAMSMGNPDFSNSSHERRINVARDIFSTTQGGLGIMRAVGLWGRFLSGHLFWKTTGNGEFVYEPSSSLTDNCANRKVWRSPLDIASDVSLMVARTCSATSFLNDQRIVDLGKHAQGIGTGPLSAACLGFAISSGLAAASGGVEMYKELKTYNSESQESRKTMRNLIFGFLCDVVDAVATIVDYGLVVLGGPIGLLVGSVLVLFSSILNLSRRSFC